MDKKVIYIIGGLAVVGIGYYLYTRNKNKSLVGGATDGGATESGATKSASAEDGATTPEGATPKTGQNIKDLKGKDYRDCLDRVKKGGVAFDGSNIQDQFYSGMTDDFDVSFR